MISVLVIVLIAAALIAVVLVLVVRMARSPDGVTQFQRQIDALSPEARRPVVDQVQQLEDAAEPDDDLDGKDRDGS